MTRLLSLFIHWVGRQFLNLVVIIVVLIGGVTLYSEFREHNELVKTTIQAEKNFFGLPKLYDLLIKSTERRLGELRSAPKDRIEGRVKEIDSEIAEWEKKRRPEIERIVAYARGDFSDLEYDLRIDLLRQEKRYLEKFVLASDCRKNQTANSQKLQRLAVELRTNQDNQQKIRQEYPVIHTVPLTAPYRELQILVAAEKVLQDQFDTIGKIINGCRVVLKGIEDPIVISREELRKHAPALQELKDKLGGHWINRLTHRANEVLPSALLILLSAILTPLLIKAFFYYVLAPLASRMSPIRIAASSAGDVGYVADPGQPGSQVSAVALGISVKAEEELLLHPEFDRSSGRDLRKSTKGLLDNKYPLSSLASGLFWLTRVQSDTDFQCSVSSSEDPLSQVALVEVSEGTELVLQPKHIVGIIRHRGSRSQITSHWRLNSVTAWLTLQLRYLTFSGPVKILVKGCQGVRIDAVGTGQVINQSHTIGFTANVPYSVQRSSPFVAYMRGKQELFDDSFSGGSGFYLSEVTPNIGKKGGIYGRGLEGLVDSVLKVFGL